LSDPTAATPAAGGPYPRHKRKLSNYLLDKRLQLRYILVVTILSGIIAGALGRMIYHQQSLSTQSIEEDLAELAGGDDKDVKNITSDYERQDRALVYKMVGAGIALVIILSLYLVIMTHKVAGPLFKVSMYFDRMAQGRLGNVTALRRGDMLQDFYMNFKDMHEAIRARAAEDVASIEAALTSLRDSRNQGDYRGEAHSKLVEQLDLLEKHLADRKKQLA
jgi:methyl-accepting chemotaxis protein